MNIFRMFWELLYEQRAEAAWGLLWALAIWVVFDLLRFGSFVRSAPRHAANTLSQLSVATLRQRISYLENYRNILRTYLSSDRTIYMHSLGMVIKVLLCMNVAGVFVIVGLIRRPDNGEYAGAALLMMLIAIFLGGSALRLTSWDSRTKITDKLAKIEQEVSSLKTKLDARDKKG